MRKKEDKSKYKYECPTCGNKFKSPQTLKGHILARHRKDINDIKLNREKKGVERTVKTEGGENMEDKDIQKLIDNAILGVKDNISQLTGKIENTASALERVTKAMPDIIAGSIKKLEEEKIKQEDQKKKEEENQKRMKAVEELVNHKDELLSFCKTNPKLCKIEIDKLIPQGGHHLPHRTVAETLACPECGPALMRGISKNLVENEEFAKKFINTVKENKAENRLEELIKLGKKGEIKDETNTGKPKEEEGKTPKEGTGPSNGETTGSGNPAGSNSESLFS